MDRCSPFPVAFPSTSFLSTNSGKSQVDPNLAYCFLFKKNLKTETLLLLFQESWTLCSNSSFGHLPTVFSLKLTLKRNWRRKGLFVLFIPLQQLTFAHFLRIPNSFAFTTLFFFLGSLMRYILN